jgi:signal transduction histidine kinase
MALKLTEAQLLSLQEVVDKKQDLTLDETSRRYEMFERLVAENAITEDEALYIKMRSVGAYLKTIDGDAGGALEILDSILQLARQKDNRLWELRTLNNIAYVKSNNGESFEAIDIWEELLTHDLDASDRVMYCTNLGAAYSRIMKPKQAIDVYFRALDIIQDSDEPIAKGDLYNNLANLHRKSGNFEKAIQHYNIAHSLYHKADLKDRLAMIYNNFSACYNEMQELDKADEYGKLALEYYQKYMPEKQLCIVLNNIAATATMRGQNNIAAEHYQRSCELAKKYADPSLIANVLNNLSLLAWEEQDFDAAIDYAQKGQKSAHTAQDVEAERISYTRLKDAWQSKHDFARAYLAQSMEMELERKISSGNAPLKIAQAEAEFLQKRLTRQLNRYREQNEALNRSNQVIGVKTTQLETQNNLLVATNSLLNRIISIIAHDVRGPIAAICQTAGLLQNGNIRENREELMQHLYESSSETQKLIDELLELTRRYKAGLDEEPEEFDLIESLRDGKKLADSVAQTKGIKISLSTNVESLPIRIAKNRLQLIVRNLISNAIKYSHPDSRIQIKVMQKDEKLDISICDEGMGMNEDQIDKILAGKAFSMKGTMSERGFGMGLVFVLEAVMHTRGSLSITSYPNKGSCFKISYHMADINP